MAYAAVLSLAQTTAKILLDQDKYPISQKKKKQIRSIYKPFIFLQEFLEDSPEKANSLDGRIRDAAYKAEAIIVPLMLEEIPSDWWTVLAAEFKFINQKREIRKETDSITRKAMMKRKEKDSSPTIQDSVRLGDASAASGQVSDVVGLHADLLAIKYRLCDGSLNLGVIPIFGMGGIGKTTLAKRAYDDPLTVQHFDIRVWVTISQEYSADVVISSLLASTEEFDRERSEESKEAGWIKVYKTLKGRRYLIVVDDIWSIDACDDIRKILPDDNNGSRIMLTTRLSNVAAYLDPLSPLHEMHLMDEDLSWNLLREKVFAHQHCPLELEVIGKEIARSCKGLPLAIVVVAGLISTVSKSPTSFREIAENINSVVATKEGRLEKIFSLSYTNLPHYLRPCLLYMGIFPEDHEVRVSKLFKLWTAEGFLKRPNGCKSWEEEAETCLEDLVKRSLVLVTKRKYNGKIKSCSLHDLMRDLCIRKGHEERFLMNVWGRYAKPFDSVRSIKNQRRISIIPSGLPYIGKLYGLTIHTILSIQHVSVLNMLQSFRLLRVLDTGDVYVRSLPDELFELFHLVYLAIYYLDMIPAAISKLQNLQTLYARARNDWKVFRFHSICLPQEIWRMRQLRHLVHYGMLPDPGETATSTLVDLQTLAIVSHYMCTEQILRRIPNLKKLQLNCSDCREGETCLNNLVYLHRLENLKLRSASSDAFCRKDSFTFPRMLKRLTLSRLPLPWDEMTVVGSLPNLRVLKLTHQACKGSTWETTEGEFPQLEYLLIENSELQHWVTESSHFPRLKSLVLDHCWQLTEIPNDIGEIPTLELIEVKGKANESLVESAERIRSEQQDLGNLLQVRCITR